MSRDAAKAWYDKTPGDPAVGWVGASDAQAAIDIIYDDMGQPATPASPTSARRFAWAGDVAGDPGAGGVISDPTGGQNRTVCLSKTDADGYAVNFAVLLPGDSVTITDDPAQPPVTGFARLVVTSDVVDQGGWWQFTAIRTDTAGTQTTPAVGTILRVIATMSAGLPVVAELPLYQYIKGQNYSSLPTTFTRLLSLPVLSASAGVYEVGFAVEWIHTVDDAEMWLRLSMDGGLDVAGLLQAQRRPGRLPDVLLGVPHEHAGGGLTLILEAKNGDRPGAAWTLSTRICGGSTCHAPRRPDGQRRGPPDTAARRRGTIHRRGGGNHRNG